MLFSISKLACRHVYATPKCYPNNSFFAIEDIHSRSLELAQVNPPQSVNRGRQIRARTVALIIAVLELLGSVGGQHSIRVVNAVGLVAGFLLSGLEEVGW